MHQNEAPPPVPGDAGRSFTYTYSAKEQEELKRIRDRYLPQEEAFDKMERIRRLDRGASEKATALSVTLGVSGTLILGGGMSLALLSSGLWLAVGVLLGVVGIAVLAPAYPLYLRILKKERERIAPEILRLTDELLK